MAKLVLATNIIADRPTNNYNIYPKRILKQSIDEFNIRASKRAIKGGELNPFAIGDIGVYTHNTLRLFLNESKMLCAEIELLDDEHGNRLAEKINNSKMVIGRPIMIVPNYVDKLKSKDKNQSNLFIVNKINSIIRVQVECNGKHE